MRHRKKGRKLSRTPSHKKASMRNMATSLFRHERIETTTAKAKELRPYAERLITHHSDREFAARNIAFDHDLIAKQPVVAYQYG